MEKISRILAVLMSIYLLFYAVKAFQSGRVIIKGVTYDRYQPVEFSISIAMIVAFALMVLGFLLAPHFMLSPLSLHGISVEGNLAAGLKVIFTIGLIFAICLKLTYNRSGS